MTDIVPNLLHLSSELTDVAELLEPALDLVLTATNAEAAAIARSALPEWSIEAARGVNRSAVPLELAGEALERDQVVARDRWLAAPVDRRAARRPGRLPQAIIVASAEARHSSIRLVRLVSRIVA